MSRSAPGPGGMSQILAWLVAGIMSLGVVIAAASNAQGRIPSSANPALANARTGCGIQPGHYPKDHLRVVGTKLEDSRGRVILPEGISIVGGPEVPDYSKTEPATDAQIDAAVAAWHVNSLRLQVSEGNLLNHPTPGYGYNRQFAGFLDRLICRTLKHHKIPIVNDNTMFTANQRSPTSTTVRFWDYMSQNYGRLPIGFDLFNEPRVLHYPDGRPLGNAGIWRIWKSGGRLGSVRYVGMQQLVNEIRIKDHASNLIWVEPAHETAYTPQLPGHLLRGKSLVYAFHKLNLTNPAIWHDSLARLKNLGIPLVDGEWAQYAAVNRPWECYSNGYTETPTYLAFLRSEGIGLYGWSLQPGAMVHATPGQRVHDGNFTAFTTDAKLLEIPNTMTSSYGCNTQSLGQGAGSLMMRYFKRSSTRLPAALFSS